MKRLETNRLILRDWNEQDLNDLFIILSNPNVALPSDSSPITTLCKCKNILDYLIDMKNNYAIELKSTGHIIGTIGLNEDAKRNTDTRNLGFSLAEEFWNQGIMTEALTVVIANAKSITKKLSATHKQNPKTEHILKKFGFQQVDVIHNIQRRANEVPHDEPYYILIL